MSVCEMHESSKRFNGIGNVSNVFDTLGLNDINGQWKMLLSDSSILRLIHSQLDQFQ